MSEPDPHPKVTRRRGLVVVFTGNGKGKTTAALGMAVRAAGHEMRVLVIQFMKSGWRYGELAALERLAPQVELVRRGEGFTWRAKDAEGLARHRLAASEALALATNALSSAQHDMIVLDEACTAVQAGLLTEEDLLLLIQRKPAVTHLVLTGRGAPVALVAAADLVTEMREIKHPYRQGVEAQKGIEF